MDRESLGLKNVDITVSGMILWEKSVESLAGGCGWLSRGGKIERERERSVTDAEIR